MKRVENWRYIISHLIIVSKKNIDVNERGEKEKKMEKGKRRKLRKRGLILRRQRLASPPCLDVSRSDHSAGSKNVTTRGRGIRKREEDLVNRRVEHIC